ncbi:MAG: hypothetical protein JO213_17380 [Alphaproteobacteria bacterium]|nr:hypothetical protein [Alphaproteobacteria bacterium]MBV9152393.1 hypothetical protein [Alphaproteobacteria bacterium]MBV9586647.1 hypothetical protein [Alphaproteobacteria bacterium]MBV9965689.1 hypothetical protein [Alphaproteobacteria bacterium]
MSDLIIQVHGLLDFIEQSLLDGIQRPDTLAECLSEADCALRVLKKLVRQDDMLCARFAVSAISNIRFFEIAQFKTLADRDEALNQKLQFIAAAKETLA